MPHRRILSALALLVISTAATSYAQTLPKRAAGALPEPPAQAASDAPAHCPPGPNQAKCIERWLKQLADAAKAISTSCSEGSCGPGPVYNGKLAQWVKPGDRQKVARGLAVFAQSQGITQQDLAAAFKSVTPTR